MMYGESFQTIAQRLLQIEHLMKKTAGVYPH